MLTLEREREREREKEKERERERETCTVESSVSRISYVYMKDVALESYFPRHTNRIQI